MFPKTSGTPKSSTLIGFSIINHPFWGTPIFGNAHMVVGSRFPNIENIKNITVQKTKKAGK